MVERGEIRDAKSILGILWLDRLRRETAPPDAVGDGATAPVAATPDRGAPDLAGVVRYGFTARQFALANARFFRSPRSALAFGLLFLVLAVVNWLLASDAWIWLGCLVLGVSFLTGLFAVPFALWSIRKRRDLLADLQLAFDADGIRARWVAGESDIRWAGIERISRNGPYLFIKFVGGTTLLVPASAFRPDQLDAFSRVALRNGFFLDGHRVDVRPA